MSQSVKAIFCDLDGTLFNSQHHPSQRTSHMVRALRDRHVAFILATGRPAKNVFETINAHALHVDFVIANNGAAIYRAVAAGESPSQLTSRGDAQQTFVPVRSHSLSPSVVKQLLALPVPCESPAQDGSAAPTSTPPAGSVPLVSTNIFKGQEWLTTCRVGRLGLSYGPSCQPVVVPELAAQPEDFYSGVVQLFFYGPHEHLLQVKAALLHAFPDWPGQMEFSFSLPHILDITAPGVDKGVAVGEVCALLGVTRDETMAFGDGMNDLAMLEASGHACVMSNAMPELKAALPGAEMVGHHSEDGVAVKLSAVFNLPLGDAPQQNAV